MLINSNTEKTLPVLRSVGMPVVPVKKPWLKVLEKKDSSRMKHKNLSKLFGN